MPRISCWSFFPAFILEGISALPRFLNISGLVFAIYCGLLFCTGTQAFEEFANPRTAFAHTHQDGFEAAEGGCDDNFAVMRAQVLSLANLDAAPEIYEDTQSSAVDGVRSVYFEGLPWQGKPTRVFALIGLPKKRGNESGNVPLPGVVLVHGGGGTAFLQWVQKWNEKGFAAISIAVEGQTNQRGRETKQWIRHDWSGPSRKGIYADSHLPLKDQWMYHSVADTILAHSLLRSLPEVDPNKTGVVGISWGGVITSTVIGIDQRFSFAVPTYGCGDLAESENQYGRALGENQLYRKVWDPMVRMDRVSIPVLWLTWPRDLHFPLDSLKGCYEKAPGVHMVSMIPGMKHSHAAGWNPPDSYAFAQSVISSGKPWCQQSNAVVDGMSGQVSFDTTKPISGANIIFTIDTGFTGTRNWQEFPAKFAQVEGKVVASGTLQPGTTAWFINILSDGLVASSDYQIIK